MEAAPRAPVRVLEAALRAGAVLTRHRDEYTADHDERVARYVRLVGYAVAPRFLLSDDVVEAIVLFSAAHDIGKVAVPDALLGKHGALDEEETARMKRHTISGSEIVEGIVERLGVAGHEHLPILRAVVRSHHELLDGSGYPDRLRGDAVPPEARIVAVADVYDALTSHRPYKPAWSHDEALAYLKSGKGTMFDPGCVDALLANESALAEIRPAAG